MRVRDGHKESEWGCCSLSSRSYYGLVLWMLANSEPLGLLIVEQNTEHCARVLNLRRILFGNENKKEKRGSERKAAFLKVDSTPLLLSAAMFPAIW